MKIDLGKTLTRAWQIVWNHKVLWIFGVFAGFANSNGSGGNGSSSEDAPGKYPGGAERFVEQARQFWEQYMLIIIATCVALALLSFAFYALGMMGRIGILKGVYKIESGASSPIFAELWSESMPYFWRFFGMNFLVGLAFLLIFIPFVVAGLLTNGIGFACLIPFICLLIPAAWAVSIILEQAQAAIVAEDLPMMDGFRRGWEIVKTVIGGMIVLSLVLGIGGGIIGFIIALPVIAAVLPAVFGMTGYRFGDAIPPAAYISIACCALYAPVLIFLNGVLTAYMKTSWAPSYLQLTQPADSPNNTPFSAQADA
ncbi:MAG: hypothetical protein DCC59_12795 [Chloroflexi bacterium]|nr:hypothetical protein [Anaerolineales bacterium]RIK50730.1 MAG: hypothetical protein DCC59_12795 [Chloroflexota bacterium]